MGEEAQTPATPTAEPTPADILIQLKSEREKNEATLVEMRKIQEEQMKIATRVAMGGSSQAGTVTKEKTVDDIAQEMADNVVKRIWGKM